MATLFPPSPHRFSSKYDSTGKTENNWLLIKISELDTGIKFAKAKDIRYLTFYKGESPHRLDLRLLNNFPDLHGLELVGDIQDLGNLAPLYALTHLRQLFLRTEAPELQLKHLPKIESLSFLDSKISGGACAKNLVDLLIYDYANKNANELAAIPNLRSLELKGCTAESVDRFSDYSNICRLVLAYPQKLTNIEEIARSKTLKDLSIHYASKVQDYRPLGQNSSIESLYLRLKSLSSCEFVKTMSKLTWIKIVARILDDSIQPLLDCVSLLDAELIPMAKSYKPQMTRQDISEYLRRNHG